MPSLAGTPREFSTQEPYGFEDFDHTLARITAAAVGAFGVGTSRTYLSFPLLFVNRDPMSRIELGEETLLLSLELQTTVGWFEVLD